MHPQSRAHPSTGHLLRVLHRCCAGTAIAPAASLLALCLFAVCFCVIFAQAKLCRSASTAHLVCSSSVGCVGFVFETPVRCIAISACRRLHWLVHPNAGTSPANRIAESHMQCDAGLCWHSLRLQACVGVFGCFAAMFADTFPVCFLARLSLLAAFATTPLAVNLRRRTAAHGQFMDGW